MPRELRGGAFHNPTGHAPLAGEKQDDGFTSLRSFILSRRPAVRARQASFNNSVESSVFLEGLVDRG